MCENISRTIRECINIFCIDAAFLKYRSCTRSWWQRLSIRQQIIRKYHFAFLRTYGRQSATLSISRLPLTSFVIIAKYSAVKIWDIGLLQKLGILLTRRVASSLLYIKNIYWFFVYWASPDVLVIWYRYLRINFRRFCKRWNEISERERWKKWGEEKVNMEKNRVRGDEREKKEKA